MTVAAAFVLLLGGGGAAFFAGGAELVGFALAGLPAPTFPLPFPDPLDFLPFIAMPAIMPPR
jgi:hypothetical protein